MRSGPLLRRQNHGHLAAFHPTGTAAAGSDERLCPVDETGRLVRRVRRDPLGREVILIDNSFEPRGPGFAGFFVELPPPVIRVPRELYIRETAHATAEDIFLTLMAPPVDRIERRYALDEIRYSEPLRARMPRVDIDTANFEHDSIVATVPLTYSYGKDGLVTLFRYGVVVTMGLAPEQELDVLRGLQPRLIRPVHPSEEESVLIEEAPDKDDQILPGGPILLKAISPDCLIVVADALSKSVVLARDEREVTAVFELVEPFARGLAEKGRAGASRRTILKHIGNALLVQ